MRVSHGDMVVIKGKLIQISCGALVVMIQNLMHDNLYKLIKNAVQDGACNDIRSEWSIHKAIFYYIQEDRGSFALMDSGKKDFIWRNFQDTSKCR